MLFQGCSKTETSGEEERANALLFDRLGAKNKKILVSVIILLSFSKILRGYGPLICLSYMYIILCCFYYYVYIILLRYEYISVRASSLNPKASVSTMSYGFSPSFVCSIKHVHCTKKWRISSVSVTKTKSAVTCGFGYIYWRTPSWKTSFFVQWLSHLIIISFLVILGGIKARSGRQEVFSKKSVLKNFAEFTVKHLCQSLRPATLF